MTALEILSPPVPEAPYATFESRQAASNAVAHFSQEMKARSLPADLVSWHDLESMLSDEDLSAVRGLTAMDPHEFGFAGSYVGDGRDTSEHGDFIRLDDQTFVLNDSERKLPPKFIPPHVYNAFMQLNQAIQIDGHQPLLIESGYRSPAYQAMLFLNFLSRSKDNNGYDFDIAEAAKRVAFPGYSEHGSWSQTAIDITTPAFRVKESTKEAVATDFDSTDEFRWMTENASDFDFFLSYPRDNQAGIQYEPWHWRYLGK